WYKYMMSPKDFRAFSSAGSEHLPYKQRVGGSNPSTPTFNLLLYRKNFGRLAQLVQSICLTSRGSAVRIRQRPQKIESVNLMINRLFYLSSTAHSRLLLLSRQRNSYQTI